HHFTARYEPTPPIPTGSRKELLKNGETGTTPVLPSRHPCDFAISTVVLGIVEVAFKILEGIGARTAIEIPVERDILESEPFATENLQRRLVPADYCYDEYCTAYFPFHTAFERRANLFAVRCGQLVRTRVVSDIEHPGEQAAAIGAAFELNPEASGKQVADRSIFRLVGACPRDIHQVFEGFPSRVDNAIID